MGTNFLQLFFTYLGVTIFVVGILVNYGEQFLPEGLLQLFRYGRANISKKTEGRKGKGILQKIEVPKSWFAHFYLATAICQSFIFFAIVNLYGIINLGSGVARSISTVLASILTFVAGDTRTESVGSATTVLIVWLFLVHITRRLYETWFVCVYSNTKMNIGHYILAFIHYSGAMLSIISQSPGFVTKIPPGKGYVLEFQELTAWFAVGIILFLYGTVEQNKAHRGFANLRKGKGQKVATLAHKIPSGGLFDTISCPNYWAEIILYISFMLMFSFRNSCWNAVAFWVILNQITSGVMNHKWYLKTFPNYPKQRKAVIPYIW